ncbi:MAG: hypothetical protein O2878_08340, partial [Bacteroidetes bacterium]|nr:hypothetical protein [Bacteroidota bacterium]
TVTINNNNTSGTYTNAVAATQTSEYEPATASAAVVTSFKPFIQAYLDNNNTVTFDIDVDNVTTSAGTVSMSTAFSSDSAALAGPDGVAGGNDAQVDNTNGVDTEAELSLF